MAARLDSVLAKKEAEHIHRFVARRTESRADMQLNTVKVRGAAAHA
jgi:hypothetical protein